MVYMQMEHEVIDIIISGEITTDFHNDVRYLPRIEVVMMELYQIQMVYLGIAHTIIVDIIALLS